MLWPGDQLSWAGGQCWILTIDHWHTLDTWCVVMVCSHEMLSVLDQTSCDGVWSDTLTAETVFTSSAQFYHDYQHSSHQPWPAWTSPDQQTWGFLRKSKWFEELDHFFWWLSLVKFVEELWDCLNECSVTDTDTTPIPGPGQYHSGDVEESCNTLLIITDSLKPAQHAATSSFTYFNIQIVSSLLHSLNDSLAFKFDQLRCSARTMQKNASFIIHCLIFSAMFYIHLIYYNLYLIEYSALKSVVRCLHSIENYWALPSNHSCSSVFQVSDMLCDNDFIHNVDESVMARPPMWQCCTMLDTISVSTMETRHNNCPPTS